MGLLRLAASLRRSFRRADRASHRPQNRRPSGRWPVVGEGLRSDVGSRSSASSCRGPRRAQRVRRRRKDRAVTRPSSGRVRSIAACSAEADLAAAFTLPGTTVRKWLPRRAEMRPFLPEWQSRASISKTAQDREPGGEGVIELDQAAEGDADTCRKDQAERGGDGKERLGDQNAPAHQHRYFALVFLAE